jgi:TetR/AcrR family transcriptional regulator, copper-responsive repressor
MKRDLPAAQAQAAAKPRGRPRSFDRDAALEAALQVFWEKGYEAASISDLTQAMGINPPSLYAAFGDKEKLFLEAARKYAQARGSSCPYVDEPTARGAIERLLTYMARDLTEASHPRGCMMMMAAVTVTDTSPQLQKALAEMRTGARDRLKERIKQGVAEGDVPAGTDANALADFYSALMTGMSMQARDGASRKSLMATVAQAMSIFPRPAKSAAKNRKRRDAVAA